MSRKPPKNSDRDQGVSDSVENSVEDSVDADQSSPDGDASDFRENSAGLDSAGLDSAQGYERETPQTIDGETVDSDAVETDSNDLDSNESLEDGSNESLENDSDDSDDFEDDDSDEDDSDDDELDEEEFSLDQLTRAYAEVLNQRPGGEPPEGDLPSESDSEDEETQGAEKSERVKIDDNAACPISPQSIIEAILFVGAPNDVKLNSRKVAAVLRDVSPKEVTKIVRELNAKYEQEAAAYRIESDGGVFKVVLDPTLVDFQQEFFGRNRQVRLSQSAIDVMAVVAYNQPVTREQVNKIRSKPSGGVLKQLVRRELLVVEPGETDPKIKYFSTTDRFLDLFRLDVISDLPQSHEFSDIDELAD